MLLFTKGTELTTFGQLNIPMMFSINLNLKTFRLLNCLHMIFLHCILRYLNLIKDKLIDLINVYSGEYPVFGLQRRMCFFHF